MESTTDIELQERISSLVNDLSDADLNVRRKARQGLIRIGEAAVPDLIDLATRKGGYARWESVEALAYIRSPQAAPMLVNFLMDDDVGVRWASSNALCGLGREALQPLMEGLTRHFDSVWMRETAHHVLHVLSSRHLLLPSETKVLNALEDIEPAAEVPWAARAALEELEKRNN